MVRRVPILAVLSLLLVAGCADAGAPADSASAASGDPGPEFETRAEHIVQAWRDSAAANAWRTGFVPLDALTLPPRDARLTDATKQAFSAGWYRLEAAMPREIGGRQGTIRYAAGQTATVPLVTLAEAYQEIDQGDPPACPGPTVPPPAENQGTEPGADPGDGTGGDQPDRPVSDAPPKACVALTVTGARLGEVSMLTNRGEAVVPAWLFTVRELTGPVARVAVAPSAITSVPEISVGNLPAQPGLVGPVHLTGVAGSRVSFQLGVGQCDENIQPQVFETGEAVVLGGTVTRRDVACPDILLLHPAQVELAQPLDARPVLSAVTGQVVAVNRAG